TQVPLREPSQKHPLPVPIPLASPGPLPSRRGLPQRGSGRGEFPLLERPRQQRQGAEPQAPPDFPAGWPPPAKLFQLGGAFQGDRRPPTSNPRNYHSYWDLSRPRA